MAKKANVEKYTDVIESSNAVHEQYKQYVDTYVHRANKELYAMLAEVLRFAEGVLNRHDKDAAILAVRKVLKEKYGIKTTTKTGDLGVLLRLVLRKVHRKTIFIYKRVLQQAVNNKVSAEELAEYIEAHGGLDKLRADERDVLAQEKYAKKQAFGNKHVSNFAADLLEAKSKDALAKFTIDRKFDARMHDMANKCKFRFMVCTYNGTYNVVDIVPMDFELEQQLLARIGNAKAKLEYIMTNEELQMHEQVKIAYAKKAGLKANASKYADRLKAANDENVVEDKEADAA